MSTPLHFVFRNIVNPLADSSSYFGLEVRSGTHLLESDKQFKMLTFTPNYANNTNGMIFNLFKEYQLQQIPSQLLQVKEQLISLSSEPILLL